MKHLAAAATIAAVLFFSQVAEANHYPAEFHYLNGCVVDTWEICTHRALPEFIFICERHVDTENKKSYLVKKEVRTGAIFFVDQIICTNDSACYLLPIYAKLRMDVR